MNGVAIIFLGLVAYGTLHIKHGALAPWQWCVASSLPLLCSPSRALTPFVGRLMIITGLITFITAILFWFFFPDSPATASFLTQEEKVVAIERIKVNQAGVENKHLKRDQIVEVFRDPKTYLFFFFAAISNVTNSVSYLAESAEWGQAVDGGTVEQPAPNHRQRIRVLGDRHYAARMCRWPC